MGVVQLFTAVAVLWSVYKAVQWWTHPLRKFPGPVVASFSNIQFSKDFLGGKQPYRQLELHNNYGPVVRVAPNELSFNTPSSWRDIYGTRKGVDTFIKSVFYDGAKFAGECTSVITERDPEKHAEMRKYLSSGFSDRSLRAQEPLIAECIDRMVARIGQVGNVPEGINMVKWYHLTTFDIIGSLAFGQDFGGVESGKDHPWVSRLSNSMLFGALADMFNRFPWVAKTLPKLMPGQIAKLTEDNRKHVEYTMEIVQKRLSSKSDRPDFLTKMVEARDLGHNISDKEIAGNVSDFVIAGSETTATILACMTYYLLKQPDLMEKLKSEVRSAFSHFDEIDAATAVPLKYLKALCLEAMRVYPPLPLAVSRIVPKGGATVDGHFIPGGVNVSTSPFAAGMSSDNFSEPFKFDPERWLKDDPTDALDACQPFLYGPRACMGKSLGWMELATIMAKIIFMYDLELVNMDLDWLRDSEMRTVWVRPDLMVRVRPRGDAKKGGK